MLTFGRAAETWYSLSCREQGGGASSSGQASGCGLATTSGLSLILNMFGVVRCGEVAIS
jgi:hypothetical protein